MKQSIRAVLVDLGDTFRVIRKDEAYMNAAKTRIAELLGVETDPIKFFETIETRYDKYREWALHYYCEAPEKILWTRWLAYDFPKARVEAAASELTYAYRKTKGERVVTDGGAETVKELNRRGYLVGIVSDLVGVHEVDEWLDRDGLRPYFQTVQQSSLSLIRKPHPALYYYALEELGVAPEEAAFVGDNLQRDIIGAKAVGLGMTVGVRYPGKKHQEVTPENAPDHFITHFSQLLELFPTLPERSR